MNNLGVSSSQPEIINPDKLINGSYQDIVRSKIQELKRSQVVAHWNFATGLQEILPFAMNTVSPTHAKLTYHVPSINTPVQDAPPKAQLSGGVRFTVCQELIVEDRAVLVPVISYMKYTHSTTIPVATEVSLELIMSEIKRWTREQKKYHKKPMDFSNILELSILNFMEKGFKIYSGTAYSAGDRRYYRTALVMNDMYIEIITSMDDLFLWKELSFNEKKKLVC